MHANDVGGFASEIETAWGGAPPSSADPFQDMSSYAGIPIRSWYATDDPYIEADHVRQFAAGTGSVAVNMGAVGHTVPESRFAEIANWLREHR
jgi:predicted alpha/beta hydrolase family esterase